MNAVSNGLIAGTVGQNGQLEAIKLKVDESKGVGISYQVKVKNTGWQEMVTDDQVAGTTGSGLPIDCLLYTSRCV